MLPEVSGSMSGPGAEVDDRSALDEPAAAQVELPAVVCGIVGQVEVGQFRDDLQRQGAIGVLHVEVVVEQDLAGGQFRQLHVVEEVAPIVRPDLVEDECGGGVGRDRDCLDEHRERVGAVERVGLREETAQ